MRKACRQAGGRQVEKPLRHGGLWSPAAPRAPPAGGLRVHDPDSDWDSDSLCQKPRELSLVDEAPFLLPQALPLR